MSLENSRYDHKNEYGIYEEKFVENRKWKEMLVVLITMLSKNSRLPYSIQEKMYACSKGTENCPFF